MRTRSIVLAAFLIAGCSSMPPRTYFAMQSNMWVNLHHFLRVVARGMPAAGDLSADERKAWDGAVAVYRQRYMNRDLLFDDGMVAINNALRVVPNDAVPDAIPGEPDLAALLQSVAPIYRKYWWPQHDADNRKWIAAAQPLVARYGAALSRRIPQSYEETWPAAPIPVDLSVSAGPVGAYTSYPPHTTIAATDPGYEGLAALEMLFHESSHQWGRRIQQLLAKSAEARHKTIPRQLWHAVLFYDAGELTRRVLAEDGKADYVESAVRSQHIYPDLCGAGCRERVVAAWTPHLDGKVSEEKALDDLVASWPDAPPPTNQ